MILLFGLPRSGTSWLGKIFDSHPGTLYRHEPDKNLQMAGVPTVFPLGDLEERRPDLERFLHRVLANRSPGVTGKRPFFPKDYRSSLLQTVRAAYGQAAKALPGRLAAQLRVPDLISGGRVRGREPRLVWKSISSVGRLGALARLMPEARIFLLLRHPCGQIASVQRGHAAGKFNIPPPSEHYRIFRMLAESGAGRAHGLTLEALRALQPEERMAWRWVLFLEKAVEETRGLSNCRLLRYEDLCERPLERARELFDLAGLDWHPQTEAFIRESTQGDSEQYFGLRKDPRRSAGKWRQELSSAQIRRILGVLARSPLASLYPEPGEEATPPGPAWVSQKAAICTGLPQA